MESFWIHSVLCWNTFPTVGVWASIDDIYQHGLVSANIDAAQSGNDYFITIKKTKSFTKGFSHTEQFMSYCLKIENIGCCGCGLGTKAEAVKIIDLPPPPSRQSRTMVTPCQLLLTFKSKFWMKTTRHPTSWRRVTMVTSMRQRQWGPPYQPIPAFQHRWSL